MCLVPVFFWGGGEGLFRHMVHKRRLQVTGTAQARPTCYLVYLPDTCISAPVRGVHTYVYGYLVAFLWPPLWIRGESNSCMYRAGLRICAYNICMFTIGSTN